VIDAAAAMAGHEVVVERQERLVRIIGPAGGLAANCGEAPQAPGRRGTMLRAEGRIEPEAEGALAPGEALIWGRA
jgi:hypothetical protein